MNTGWNIDRFTDPNTNRYFGLHNSQLENGGLTVQELRTGVCTVFVKNEAVS